MRYATLDSTLPAVRWGVLKELVLLCKLNVVVVMLVCTAVGMALSTPGVPPLKAVIYGLLGVGLASSGAAVFNHIIDRHLDAVMTRTSRRPLAAHRLPVWGAVLWAVGLSVAGIGLLAWQVNTLVAALTLASLVGYAVLYTAYLKRATPQNIVIGGVAGASPPLLGWVAVTGSVSAEPLLLMLIIFVWTPPHFWSLAIHKRDDYARAGIPMLPVTHGVVFTQLQIWLYSWLTVAASLLPVVVGMSGWVYLVIAVALNARFIYWSWRVWKGDDQEAPLLAFWFSIRYLLGLFGALLLDHYTFLLPSALG
ncbi:heme o synthase [Halomonas sp. KM072]